MLEPQTPKKGELSEVMMAMDVVDTLRYQHSLVDRELQSEEREAELIRKMRKIYADQGLEVSDAVIAEGVKAMREERFTYAPPPVGLETRLAKIYVNRMQWAKRVMWLVIVLVAVWTAYHFLYTVPEEHGRRQLAQELKTREKAQQADINGLKAQIDVSTRNLENVMQSVPAQVRKPANRISKQARQSLASAAQQTTAAEKLEPLAAVDPQDEESNTKQVRHWLSERNEILNLARTDIKNAQGNINTIQSMKAGYVELDTLHADALKAAREPSTPDKIDAIYNDAHAAFISGDVETALAGTRALEITREMLMQSYTLQVVSRPGTPSGVWRYPESSRTARNYYLIVEAVSPSGQRVKLPITSEEDGSVREMREWGLRVDQAVYDRVGRDKQEDGIVNDKVIGRKKQGYLTPEYTIATTGETINQW